MKKLELTPCRWEDQHPGADAAGIVFGWEYTADSVEYSGPPEPLNEAVPATLSLQGRHETGSIAATTKN
jgi:hypothetical protein